MGIYEERSYDFGRFYEDFESDDVARLIIATGEWLERLVLDPQAVDTAMKALLPHPARDPASPWREAWEELDAGNAMVLPLSQFFVALNSFAYFGLRPDRSVTGLPYGEDAPLQDLTERIAGGLARARAFYESVPPGWADLPDIGRTLLAAEARFNIDLGRGVSVDQLAALARVSPKSIRNILSPQGQGGLRMDETGTIPAADALTWLRKRDDFMSSLWQAGPEADETEAGQAAPEPAILGRVVFVPAAKDGTWFDPRTCRTASGYTIGAKGAEETIADYFEALARLTEMPTPHWRRPSPAGKRGIVAGVAWLRKPVSELDLPGGTGHV